MGYGEENESSSMAEIAGKSESDAVRMWNLFKDMTTCACELKMCSKKVKYGEGRVGVLKRFAEDLKDVREESASALGYRKHLLLVQ